MVQNYGTTIFNCEKGKAKSPTVSSFAGTSPILLVVVELSLINCVGRRPCISCIWIDHRWSRYSNYLLIGIPWVFDVVNAVNMLENENILMSVITGMPNLLGFIPDHQLPDRSPELMQLCSCNWNEEHRLRCSMVIVCIISVISLSSGISPVTGSV